MNSRKLSGSGIIYTIYSKWFQKMINDLFILDAFSVYFQFWSQSSFSEPPLSNSPNSHFVLFKYTRDLYVKDWYKYVTLVKCNV